MKLLLLLLALLVAGTTTAQTNPPKTARKAVAKKTTGKAKSTTQPAAPAPVLTFERTVCYGTCPAYVVSVQADGQATYEGHRFVPVTGKKTFQVDKAVLAEALRMAKEADFIKLQLHYTNGITDVPSAIVGVRLPNAGLKTVMVENSEPEALHNLIAYLRAHFDPVAGLTEGR